MTNVVNCTICTAAVGAGRVSFVALVLCERCALVVTNPDQPWAASQALAKARAQLFPPVDPSLQPGLFEPIVKGVSEAEIRGLASGLKAVHQVRVPSELVIPECVSAFLRRLGLDVPIAVSLPPMPAAGAEIPGSVESGHADASTSPDVASRNLGESKPAAGTPTPDLSDADALTMAHGLVGSGEAIGGSFGLVDRLDAISSDIRDAFNDVVDLDYAKPVLASLYHAANEIRVAQVTLLRSHP